MRDLYHASRDDLIRIILQQDELIAGQTRRLTAQEQELAALRQTVEQLTKQVGELLVRLGTGDGPGGTSRPKGMPGLKSTQASPPESRPRTRRTRGYGRKRMVPTRIERHAMRRCPECDAGLSGGTIKRTREVIELAAPRIEVIEHQYVERRCPGCGKRCVPVPRLRGAVSGQGRLGHRLTSEVVMLREEARLPVRTIQQVLQTLTGLHLSTGAIVHASQQIAGHAETAVQAIQTAIRASPVAHLDETGWRRMDTTSISGQPAPQPIVCSSTGLGKKKWSTP